MNAEMLIFTAILSGFLDNLSQRVPAESFRISVENHQFQDLYVFLRGGTYKPFKARTAFAVSIMEGENDDNESIFSLRSVSLS